MRSNTKVKSETVKTTAFEGGPAVIESAQKELTRAVSACMLFENSFYEKGSDLATRISELAHKVPLKFLSDLAVKCRTELNLRHVSLFLAVQTLTHPKREGYEWLVRDTVDRVILRADELAEIIAIYWRDGKKSLPRQLKLGIARAFLKFNEYNFGKYKGTGNQITLRDAMFMTHPTPNDKDMVKLFKKIASDTLKTPDTWEVQLSAGKDKKETFTRLIKEEKLGYMALLRNLRNMTEAKVDTKIINKALTDGAETSKALPFRFVSAVKHAPAFARSLSDAMLSALKTNPNKLKGTTAIVVDVSGSMDSALSEKSEMTRLEAASALAVYASEIGQARVFTFSDDLVEVPAHRGLALVEAISNSQDHSSTMLGEALRELNDEKFDRIIVITDEQSHDSIPAFKGKGYILNVATYQPALPTGKNGWTRISGFSERVIDWMIQEELAD